MRDELTVYILVEKWYKIQLFAIYYVKSPKESRCLVLLFFKMPHLVSEVFLEKFSKFKGALEQCPLVSHQTVSTLKSLTLLLLSTHLPPRLERYQDTVLPYQPKVPTER